MTTINDDPFPQTIRGKIAKAKAIKDEGNLFFKQEKYAKAKQKYATALAYTRGLSGRDGNGGDNQMAKFAEASVSSKEGKMGPAENREVDELDAIIKTNIAACFLKLNKPINALQYAREAIIHNPSYWKASLRAAEALEQTGNYDGALKQLDLLSGVSATTNDPGFIRTMRNIHDKVLAGMKAENKRQKKAFNNIFCRMNKEDSVDGAEKSSLPTEAVAAPVAVLECQTTNPDTTDDSGNKNG